MYLCGDLKFSAQNYNNEEKDKIAKKTKNTINGFHNGKLLSINKFLLLQIKCAGHALEFLQLLPSSETDMFQELWVCIHCGHERVLTHHIGARD